ncbi:hypothetical protein DPB93_14110 [Salmonella enterica subsp. salamae]|nr:hypothetical protein [Salmonella enterica subsp. salamae]ECI4076782.1 hypothetical protein [Salmonella enterica subsp. salamae]EEO2381632.1 hypothetical protein [Salmonella enterica]
MTKNGEAALNSFEMVRLLKDGKTEDKPYWVTQDPELMESGGGIQALLKRDTDQINRFFGWTNIPFIPRFAYSG